MKTWFVIVFSLSFLLGGTSISIGGGDPVSWRSRYELGPGDVINLNLFKGGGQEQAGESIAVGPDGTITFMQAKRVKAAGKTLKELKAALESVLSKDLNAPIVIVTPVQISSKKYVVLGKVGRNGSYPIDRPLTLIEAIAKSGGISSGPRGELIDFERSFVLRNKRKLDVDMEGLYYKGDMRQNIQIEPDDYIYIASNITNECYVFGEVLRPGAIPIGPGNSTGIPSLGAIATAGGYGQKAWKKKVLVVRGSLNEPETIMVDSKAVMKGKIPDMLLRPGDIVYVNARPWAKAEELLDLAIISFLRASIGIAVAEDEGDSGVSLGL